MVLPILLSKTKLLPIYIVRMNNTKDQGKIFRKEGFHTYQIFYCTEGSGIFRAEGREYKIGAGDAFFFRPDIPHEYFPVKKPWKATWITYEGSSAGQIADYLGLGNTAAFSLKNTKEFETQTSALYDMFESDHPDKDIKISCMLYKMLIKIGECHNNLPQSGGMTQNEKYRKLIPVIDMMREKYSKDLSLELMAKEIAITPNHLCRLFNQVYGTTPLKYLTQIRLNAAKELLCSYDDIKIKKIAEETGFSNPSYFCAVFKKSENMTPEDYRRLNRF